MLLPWCFDWRSTLSPVLLVHQSSSHVQSYLVRSIRNLHGVGILRGPSILISFSVRTHPLPIDRRDALFLHTSTGGSSPHLEPILPADVEGVLQALGGVKRSVGRARPGDRYNGYLGVVLECCIAHAPKEAQEGV